MAFTKNELQAELLEFMQGYANGVERLYGGSVAEILSTTNFIQQSPLWIAVNEMYDYGVLGTSVEKLSTDLLIDGSHADAEVFFNGIATNAMQGYLDEDDVIYPEKCIHTVRIAVARVVLEGGERYTDYGAGEYGLGYGDWGYLTLSEVALLADMDERSVRNAANPKANNPLKTESVGKRSLVTPPEAKRWLAGRKGFIATQLDYVENNRVVNKEISLPEEVVTLLNLKAEQSGLSLVDFIKTVI